ncbi:hypothetical protein [uncultured Dubosiella sp.]|uniref:hypothetical protein n=1 Tax=uncultured Dubosiella sp. TaxID=1937011 RepID=UPI0025B4AE8F|nr:hypothetical protein [uncultured Dubosiella sp.]
MLRQFYYSDLFIDGQEITPYYIPQFILSGEKHKPYLNYPFIYSCNVTDWGIELHSLPYPKIGHDIAYKDIKYIDLYVVKRVWGIAWTMLIAPEFNLDLIVHTYDHDEEIEIPACFEGKRMCEKIRENGVPVYDRFHIYEQFPDAQSFRAGFAQHFLERYPALAEKYNLDDPRMGFKKPDSLKGLWKKS